jgi:hypothetical protein
MDKILLTEVTNFYHNPGIVMEVKKGETCGTNKGYKKCIQKIWMQKSHEEKDNGRLRQKLRFNIKMDLEK